MTDTTVPSPSQSQSDPKGGISSTVDVTVQKSQNSQADPHTQDPPKSDPSDAANANNKKTSDQSKETADPQQNATDSTNTSAGSPAGTQKDPEQQSEVKAGESDKSVKEEENNTTSDTTKKEHTEDAPSNEQDKKTDSTDDHISSNASKDTTRDDSQKSDTNLQKDTSKIDEEKKIRSVSNNQDDSVEGARLAKMTERIAQTKAPEDLKERAQLMIKQGMSSIKYGQIAPLEQAEQYVNLVTKLPWGKRSQDNLDLKNVKQMLNKNHYGMDSLKERIIEYLAVLKLQQRRAQETGEEQTVSKAPIVCFVGLVGTGKTTVAYSIAEAMGREFVRIPFGGMGSAADLRGQSRIHPDAEPGLILKAYMQAGVINPVILLDEIDRVTEAARADIMGVLVELLDPKQNAAFVDHYLDFPFNLSETIFIGTANNTKHIATAVMDRIEPLQMPSYSDKEKIVIGRDFVLPKQLKNCGLTSDQLKIADDVWQKIVRPTGFDAGIRTLERTVNGICRKTAREIVEGRTNSVAISQENLKNYIQQW